VSGGRPLRTRPPRAWVQLWLAREREFLREPGVLFWVFGFPVLLAVALGLAFRGRGPERSPIVVAAAPESGEDARRVAEALSSSPLLDVRTEAPDAARARLERGDALVLVRPGRAPSLEHDPGRPGARAAAALVRDALERAAGRRDVTSARDAEVSAPGKRYVDFLLPGLLGMSLMSGGIWGVGWAVVNLRIKRLLKRLAATPMRRSSFLGSFLLHRLVVAAAETTFLLAFGWFAFGVEVRGSLATVFAIALAGAASFSGLGLLVGSRARNAETANGLMNLATLPMWVLSGVFFSASNFPDAMRPFVDALPLTALNDALRAVIGEGAGLGDVARPLAVLAAWGLGTFALALRFFRWR
jgi:ABC-2 type transport system permease protein